MNFKLIEGCANNIAITGDFLEIGAERGDGSTVILGNLARDYNKILHSVDLDADIIAKQVTLNEENKLPIKFYNSKGEDFLDTHAFLKFSIVLLDNFDWIWDINNIPNFIKDQVNNYKSKHNMTMDNMQSQIAHLTQAIKLTNMLTRGALVICDDTFSTGTGTFNGKCGAAVPYLVSCGFSVLDVPGSTIGTILIRN